MPRSASRNVLAVLLLTFPLAAHVSLSKLPLSFEVNQGQTAAAVKFLSRGPGHALFLMTDGVVLAGKTGVVRMKLLRANAAAQITGLDPLPGRSNYFLGNDPAKWRTGVLQYARVEYRDVYPGVNLVFYSSRQGELEHDWVVAPGADPRHIRLAFEGAQPRLDLNGDLVFGDLRLSRPIAWQEVNGTRHNIPVDFNL